MIQLSQNATRQTETSSELSHGPFCRILTKRTPPQQSCDCGSCFEFPHVEADLTKELAEHRRAYMRWVIREACPTRSAYSSLGSAHSLRESLGTPWKRRTRRIGSSPIINSSGSLPISSNSTRIVRMPSPLKATCASSMTMRDAGSREQHHRRCWI
jgi:hypothetical protein